MRNRFAIFSVLFCFLILIDLDGYAAVPSPQRSTIYNSGPRDDYVPGDLILKLKPGVKLRVPWPTNAKYRSDLDRILDQAQAKSVQPVFKPEQLQVKRSTTYTLYGRQQPVPDLSTIYQLKFPLSTDIPALVEELSSQPEVVWTEANLIYRAHATPNDPDFAQQQRQLYYNPWCCLLRITSSIDFVTILT